ncbi:hypothetical protein RI367_001064 [Sorochytrium milnesiophthora]
MLTYADWQTYAALAVFAFVWLLVAQVPLPRFLTRLGIASFGRTPATVFGACAMVALGVVSPRQAFASQRPETLLLLAGLMVMLAKFEEKGLMESCQRIMLRGHKLSPLQLLVRVSMMAGVLGALLMNDGALDMVPYAMAVATSANIGSTALLIGNPKTMLIAEFDDSMTFVHYMLRMALPTILALVCNTALLYLFYRPSLRDVRIQHLKALQNDNAARGGANALSEERQTATDDDEVKSWMYESDHDYSDDDDDDDYGSSGESSSSGCMSPITPAFNAQTPLLHSPFRANVKSATTFADEKNLWATTALPARVKILEAPPARQFSLKPLNLAQRVREHSGAVPSSPIQDAYPTISPISQGSRHSRSRLSEQSFTKLSQAVFVLALLGMYTAFTLRLDLAFSCLFTVSTVLFLDHIIMSAKQHWCTPTQRRSRQAPSTIADSGNEPTDGPANTSSFIVDSINWGLLMYLFAIFIVIQGVQNTPLPNDITRLLKALAAWQPLTSNGGGSSWDLRLQLVIISTVFAILIMALALVFTSIPVVLLVAPALQTLAAEHALPHALSSSSSEAMFVSISWYLLAWSTSLCGNITPFSSVAGLIVSEICKPGGSAATEADEERHHHQQQRWIGQLTVWIRFAAWSTVLLLLTGACFVTVFAQ